MRLDPTGCRIEPYHEGEFPRGAPATIEVWQGRLEAVAVFNAGLYTEDRTHLGALRRSGEDIGGDEHKRWNAVLVSGSRDGLPAPATILDLSVESDREAAPRYSNAVQSMMLLDRTGRTRVRKSDRIAPRTLVAELASGSLLVVVTEGSYTLWETAALLREADWGIVEAMALDGGNESNLAVASDSVRYQTGGGGADFAFRLKTPLPGVIAVWSRAETE
jgi:hypothetical protein